MNSLGVTGINVTNVTRIHNWFLRNRFEDKLEQNTDVSDQNYKGSLEYLFYGIDPVQPSEIFKIINDGFRSPEEYT